MIDELTYGTYRYNRDRGMTHEALVSVSRVFTLAMKTRYEEEATVKAH